MGRRHPSRVYWVCTIVAGLTVMVGTFAAMATGKFDLWTFAGAVAFAVLVWLAGAIVG